VVVIIAGSGPTDRDGNQPFMKNDSLKLLGKGSGRQGDCGTLLRQARRAHSASSPGPALLTMARLSQQSAASPCGHPLRAA